MLIGSCDKNQTCIKIQECPSTKKALEHMTTITDATEKEKIIASIKSLICGRITERTVCCDIENGEYISDFIFQLLNFNNYCISFRWFQFFFTTFC